MRSVTAEMKSLEKHAPDLARRGWRLAWSLLRHAQAAEDVVQQAFVIAARKAHRVPLDDPWPWFGTVVAREARNARRKLSRRNTHAASDQEQFVSFPDENADPADKAALRDLHRTVQTELDRLPPDEREALVLTLVGGLTFRQAARATGVSAGSFQRRSKRGMETLRRRLGVSETRTAGLMAALPVPAVPAGLIDSVTASLPHSGVTATVARNLFTGGVMFKLITLLLPLTMAVTVLSFMLPDGQDTPTGNDVSRSLTEGSPTGDAGTATGVRGHDADSGATTGGDLSDLAGDMTAAQGGESADTPEGTGPHTLNDDDDGDGRTTSSAPGDDTDESDQAAGDAERVVEPGRMGAAGTLGELAPFDTGAYIRDFSYSPDGRAIYAGGYELLTKLDARTGEREWTTDVTDYPVESVAISPDGKTLATSGSGSSDICIRNASTGEILHTVPESGPGHRLCFTPDGRYLVGAFDSVRLWDLDTRELERSFPYTENDDDWDSDHRRDLECLELAITPDGRFLMGFFEDTRSIRKWDFATGRLMIDIRAGDIGLGENWSDAEFDRCLFDAQGQVAVCMMTGYYELDDDSDPRAMALASAPAIPLSIDLESGQLMAVSQVIGDGTLGLTPDGKYALTNSLDPKRFEETIVLWNPESGKKVRELEVPFATLYDGLIRFDPEGKHFAAWNFNSLGVHKLSNGKLVAPKKKAGAVSHGGGIGVIEFSSDGRYVVTGCNERDTICWDVETLEPVSELKDPPVPAGAPSFEISGMPAPGAGFTEDGKAIVSVAPNTLKLTAWNVKNGRALRTRFDERGSDAIPAGALHDLQTSRTGDRLIALTSSAVAAWDIESGKRESLLAHPEGASLPYSRLASIAVSHDGLRAWVCFDGEITLYDMEKDETRTLARLEGLDDGWYPLLRVTADDEKLVMVATHSETGARRIMTLSGSDGKILTDIPLETRKSIRARASKERSELRSNLRDLRREDKDAYKKARDAYREALRELTEQRDRDIAALGPAGDLTIHDFDVTPDGRYIVAGGNVADKSFDVMLLDVATGRVVTRFSGHTDTVNCVRVSPDGHFAVTGGDDTVAKVWKLPSSK